MNIFNRKTPDDLIKENKREIRHGQRNLDRDYKELERQEAQLISQIKALARKGDNASARVLTKQLINVRSQKEKLMKTKGSKI